MAALVETGIPNIEHIIISCQKIINLYNNANFLGELELPALELQNSASYKCGGPFSCGARIKEMTYCISGSYTNRKIKIMCFCLFKTIVRSANLHD
jgi:hypothetical protein